MQSYAIETTGLTKRFGKRVVVDNLRLQVPRGSVYAFLGRNGAGKTTTIRLLLDQLRRNAGAATVLGYDSIKGSRDIRQLVGFVAQQEDLYDWMTVDEILWFCRGFYPTWDQTLAAAMQAQLKLDGKTKIRAMSKGTQRQLALLLALAFRPELLILDEPTAGLDVVVRRDFLESVIGLAQEEGRTIFFSSHLVHEVERVADWVGIMDNGRLLCNMPLETLKAGTRRLVCRFPEAAPQRAAIPRVLTYEPLGREAVAVVRNFSETTVAEMTALGAADVQVEAMTLEDIFVAMVGREDAR